MGLKREILITTNKQSLGRDRVNELAKQAEKHFLPSMADGFPLCTKLRNSSIRHEFQIKPLFIYTTLHWATLRFSHLYSSLGCFPLEVNQALPTVRSPGERPRTSWRDDKTQVAWNWGKLSGEKNACVALVALLPQVARKWMNAGWKFQSIITIMTFKISR